MIQVKYCWWFRNPANPLSLVFFYHTIYSDLYILGCDRRISEPSTVWNMFFTHRPSTVVHPLGIPLDLWGSTTHIWWQSFWAQKILSIFSSPDRYLVVDATSSTPQVAVYNMAVNTTLVHYFSCALWCCTILSVVGWLKLIIPSWWQTWLRLAFLPFVFQIFVRIQQLQDTVNKPLPVNSQGDSEGNLHVYGIEIGHFRPKSRTISENCSL